MADRICDHKKLDVYRLSIEYVVASYGVAKGSSPNKAVNRSGRRYRF